MRQELILPSDLYKKLSGVQLASKSKLRGQHKGSHRSNRFGSSMDFSDYRSYHVGDDVRQIDWNVYARSEKYYIKRFLDEQEMRVQILVDGTKSMAINEGKWLFTKQIAAAFGHIVLQHDDRLHCAFVTEQSIPAFRKKGGIYKNQFAHIMATLPEANRVTSFCEGALKQLVKGHTVLILITDGLEAIENWEKLLSRLPHYAGDIRIIQVLTEAEQNPQWNGDLELTDIENGAVLNISMSTSVKAKYEQAKLQHEKKFAQLCAKYGVNTIQLTVEEGFSYAFFQRLKKANWVK